MRHLPIRIPPLPGESFASYVDRLAHDTNAPLLALLRALGLVDEEHDKAIGPGYGIALAPERLALLASALELPEEQVARLFLGSYDRVAVDFTGLDPDDRASIAKVALREWAYFSGSHVCPSCLSESGGAWQLKWKLPWSFACVRHKSLLADACPRCERRIGMARQDGSSRPRFVSHVPQPGYCANAQPPGIAAIGRASTSCGHPLTEIDTEPLNRYRRLLVAQDALDRALEASSVPLEGDVVATFDYFLTLRSLCALHLYAAQVSDLGKVPSIVARGFGSYVADRDARAEGREAIRLSGGDFRRGRKTRYFVGAPKSAAIMAGIATTSVEILDSGDVSGTDSLDRVAWLFDRAYERDPRALDLLPGYFSFPPHLKRAFDRYRAPVRRFTTKLDASPVADEGGTPSYLALTVDHVPQLLWEARYEELFADLIPGVRADYARRVCSMALVRLTGTHTWKQAAEALDLPASAGHGMANKVVSTLTSTNNADLFHSRLRTLAAQIADDPDRINYGFRRRTLIYLTEIDREDWRGICRDAGVPVGKRGGKSRYAAAWLWSHLTEGDYRRSPGLREKDGETEREMYRRFLKNDFGPLKEWLVKYGRGMLGIR